MSLPADLLQQARKLATLDPRRPKQVNLRRSASTSYYALFHLLTAEASGIYAGDLSLLARISRTHSHADMKKVSTQFAANKLPKSVAPRGSYITPPDLLTVALAFLNLQQARHEADYDLLRVFSRSEVLNLAQQVEQAFDAWKRIKSSDDARLYLACFLLWKRWDEDPR